MNRKRICIVQQRAIEGLLRKVLRHPCHEQGSQEPGQGKRPNNPTHQTVTQGSGWPLASWSRIRGRFTPGRLSAVSGVHGGGIAHVERRTDQTIGGCRIPLPGAKRLQESRSSIR